MLLAAAAAAAVAFALAAALFVLLLGPLEGWAYLALFTVVPAAALAMLAFFARIFAFLLGILAFAACSSMELGGPDSPLLVLPILAASLAAAAVIAELSARCLHRIFRAAPDRG